MTERERCVDFIVRLADRAAKTKVPSQYGVAHLNTDLPRVWSRNYLFADGDLGAVTAEELAAEADRILGAARLTHRKVELVDEEAGDRLEPQFRELGWEIECAVVMIARRDRDRDVDTSIVDEVPIEELLPVWSHGWQTDPRVQDDDVVQQLVENRRVMAAAVDTSLLRGARRRRDRVLLRAVLRTGHRPDRGRAHPRAVPEPRPGTGDGDARPRRLTRGGARPHLPARGPRRLAEGALREAGLRRDRPRLGVPAPARHLRGRGSYHRRTSKGGNDGPERVLGEVDRR